MTLYKTWKEYVKFKRFEKGYTFSEMGEKLNISPEFYKKVELGKVQPSRSLFQKLVKILELDEITCVVLIKQELANLNGSLVVRRSDNEISVK